MALSDPQSITINAIANSLPRITTGPNTSTYQSADGLIQLTVSSSYGKRVRRTVRVTQTKISADPYLPAQNVKQSMSFYFVFDLPLVGFTPTEAKYVSDGFITMMAASSGALWTKVLGGEN